MSTDDIQHDPFERLFRQAGAYWTAELEPALNDALERLPSRDALLIDMAYFRRLSPSDIAGRWAARDAHLTTAEAVEERLGACLQQVQSHLGEALGEEVSRERVERLLRIAAQALDAEVYAAAEASLPAGETREAASAGDADRARMRIVVRQMAEADRLTDAGTLEGGLVPLLAASRQSGYSYVFAGARRRSSREEAPRRAVDPVAVLLDAEHLLRGGEANELVIGTREGQQVCLRYDPDEERFCFHNLRRAGTMERVREFRVRLLRGGDELFSGASEDGEVCLPADVVAAIQPGTTLDVAPGGAPEAE